MDLTEQFKKYPFVLDTFQKEAIKSIENGEHVLVCAPTGSGKSLVAQHATDWGLRQKKRVIYTTPIKSLSNQAYASLARDFGADKVGIMTGDNQYNPTADVLIMTTEILRNFLLDGRTRKHVSEETESDDEDTQYWTMNVSADVSMVVFDEVHYLQDPHRGYVWETCFVHMPPHVSMTMLSATISNPDTLVSWLTKVKDHPVSLCVHTTRAVPLTHLLFTNLNPTNHQLPDSCLHSYKNAMVDVTKWSVPELEHYVKPISTHYDWFQKGSTAIEGCIKFLHETDKMPALCFVLSRKRCEQICATWSTSLLTKDEVALIYKDWKQIVREATRGDVATLASVEALPQYRLLTESIQKGVAFHHSGVLPVLKECVEVLMKDGRIPCVFATETFAVGINSPTRTVVMTQIDKRTEGGVRCLEPHEYTQMGGRAGRRGLDTVGYVVSLPIAFVKKTGAIMYHRMLHGDPVHISSTQIIPSSQVLRAMRSSETAEVSFDSLMKILGERSMRSYEIQSESTDEASDSKLVVLNPEEQKLWDEWVKINNRPSKTQGQQKKKQKKLSDWQKKVDDTIWTSAKTKMETNLNIEEESRIKEDRNKELLYTLRVRLDYLKSIEFISEDADKRTYTLTEAGKSACVIQQGNPCHTAYVLHSLGNFHTDETDALYLLCFASLFLTPDEKQENGCEVIHRDIIGHICMKEIETASAKWDTHAQVHSCWESNELNYELLESLSKLRDIDEEKGVINYFTMQKLTCWQEGRLWKTLNDLVSICGEIQELWGNLGYVNLFKKMGEAQAIAKGCTLMIPSLYLQPVSFGTDRDCE